MINRLKDYEKEGLLYSQVHPTLPLTIYNYTDKVQWEGLWDEATLMCRGLVVDDLGIIVAKPFSKFFNFSENKTNTTNNFEIYEKLDGSLIILFNYSDKWLFASRGSFTSDQVKMAEGIGINLESLNKEFTYCFELIHPDNRIVVDYGDKRDLILTGVFSTKTAEEQPIDIWNLTYAKKFNLNTPLHELHSIINDNEEGYVIRFDNGERCKIKGSEYLRLHKIMSEMSTTAVWECLSNNQDITTILNNVPDEYFGKIKQYSKELRNRFEFRKSWLELEYLTKYKDIKTSKELALEIKDLEYKHFIFSLYNGKDITESVWKSVKPEYKRL